jgi:sugar phosphate permease
MFFGFIAWIFILWFPTYLVEARGFSRMGMGLVGMLPTVASFLGIVAGGVVSDYLLKKGFSPRTARARFPGLSVGLSLPLLLMAVTTASATLSVILFIGFYFILSLAVSGYWSMPLELNPHLVGAISGVMNTAGNLAGVFGPLTAGFIVARTGSWVLPFYLAAALGVFCSLIFFFFVSIKPITIAGLAPAAALREVVSDLSHRS